MRWQRSVALALMLGIACTQERGEEEPDVEARSELSELKEKLRARRLERESRRKESAWPSRPALSPEERAQREAALAAQDAVARQELESESAEVRAEALDRVDMQGPGRDRVFELARNDPDPTVRAAAVWRVSDEDSAEAFQVLHAALGDGDPHVVRTAIDALEGVGDEASVAPLLRLAQESPDSDLRRRAREVAEFLE